MRSEIEQIVDRYMQADCLASKPTGNAPASSTTASTVATAAPTVADIDAMVRVVEEFQRRDHELIAKWMAEKGFDPVKGGCLLLPAQLGDQFPFPPAFVFFSRFVDRPYLIQNP